MGMTKFQVLRMVELPLALSVIMAGLRTALVIAIGITAIGTFVGAGGLGDMIVRGSNATNGTAIILAGAIPTAVMAVGADLLMAWLERALSPVKKKEPGRNMFNQLHRIEKDQGTILISILFSLMAYQSKRRKFKRSKKSFLRQDLNRIKSCILFRTQIK